MRSSTSSSKSRLPHCGWLKVWAPGLILALIGVAEWNHVWTDRGFTPGVSNSANAWAEARAKVSPEAVVVLGTSRAQAAIDPSVWQKAWPERPIVNLAMVGTSPLATFEHLAGTTGFSGILIVDFPPFFVFNVDRDPNTLTMGLDAWRELRSSPSRRWEAALGSLLDEGAVLRHPDLNLRLALGGILTGSIPSPPTFTMRRDRFNFLSQDYQKLPLNSADYEIYRTGGAAATPLQRDSILARFGAALEGLRARGGDAVFISFPTCGERRRIEAQRYPSSTYWEVAKIKIDGVFLGDEYPELDGDSWLCADGSHLHVEDTEPFTRWLATFVRSIL